MGTEQVTSYMSNVYADHKLFLPFYLQLLDIFTLDDGKSSKSGKRAQGSTEPESSSGLPAGFRVALESLPELWSEENYENEYDLDSFISTLNKH